MFRTKQERLDHIHEWIRTITERLEAMDGDCSGIREDNPEAFTDEGDKKEYPKVISIIHSSTVNDTGVLYGLDEDGNVLKAYDCNGWTMWIENKEYRKED